MHKQSIPSEMADKAELIAAIDSAVAHLIDLSALLDADKINIVPHTGSWTPGQLFDHVTKSISLMAKAMAKKTAPADRHAGDKIAFLNKIFLDFDKKLDAPDIITPSAASYEKEEMIHNLRNALGVLKENTSDADLQELVHGLPLGEVTKLEILHFVLYHTMRHTHQFEKISAALTENH